MLPEEVPRVPCMFRDTQHKSVGCLSSDHILITTFANGENLGSTIIEWVMLAILDSLRNYSNRLKGYAFMDASDSTIPTSWQESLASNRLA